MLPIELEAPAAFYFNVAFTGFDPPVPDMAFQSVEGLEIEIETEDLREGGDNVATYALPKPVKRTNLKLKRGLGLATSGLVYWCRTTIEGGLIQQIKTKTIIVNLLEAQGLPIATWTVNNAYPVKWSVGAFDSMKNEIAIETVEFAYSDLVRRT